VDNCSAYANYRNDSKEYSVNLINKQSYHPEDTPEFFIELYIDDGNQNFYREIPLTEKEYMELKWIIEEWCTVLELRAFDAFKEFCELEPGSMDDLLND
jgi:hypothetical protein